MVPPVPNSGRSAVLLEWKFLVVPSTDPQSSHFCSRIYVICGKILFLYLGVKHLPSVKPVDAFCIVAITFGLQWSIQPQNNPIRMNLKMSTGNSETWPFSFSRRRGMQMQLQELLQPFCHHVVRQLEYRVGTLRTDPTSTQRASLLIWLCLNPVR